MCQFERTKCRFLFCLGISFTVCSFIYLSNDIQTDPKPLEAGSCRPFSSTCKAYLPGATEGVQWQRRDCQVSRAFAYHFYCISDDYMENRAGAPSILLLSNLLNIENKEITFFF